MSLEAALKHPWLTRYHANGVPYDHEEPDRSIRGSTVGLIDTPRLPNVSEKEPSRDDYSQPMGRLQIQTPPQLAGRHRNQNYFSIDSSQGQLAGQSRVFEDNDRDDAQAMSSSPTQEKEFIRQRHLMDLPSFVPETQSQEPRAVVSRRAEEAEPDSNRVGPFRKDAAAIEPLDGTASKLIDVEIEMEGPEQIQAHHDTLDEGIRNRATSSPLSSLPIQYQKGEEAHQPRVMPDDPTPPTAPLISPSLESPAFMAAQNQLAEPTDTNNDIDRSKPHRTKNDPPVAVPELARSYTKQKLAGETDSPRPKKRAATVLARNVLASSNLNEAVISPSKREPDVKSDHPSPLMKSSHPTNKSNPGTGVLPTRTSARLRKKQGAA